MVNVYDKKIHRNVPEGKELVAGTKPVKLKRRPWRDKVRKKARKAAKAKERERLSEDVQVPHGLSDCKKRRKKRRVKREENGIDSLEKQSVESPIQEGLNKLAAGRFRFLNEQLYTSTGAEAYDYFQKDPDAFRCYHKGFAEQVLKWPNHPLNTIIGWLRRIPKGFVVLDMGCGDAKIASTVGELHKVHSYDLVATNSLVVACDMAHLPVEDSYADIVIFCLSLMGSNLIDYIKEARRVLKLGGILKIAEVASRFVNVRLFCNALCKLGFEKTEKKQITNYFIMLEFRKIEKVENKRPYGLKLKPCLYKRR